jgi:hemolysin secretion/activation protein ShlB/FhaC/HecB
MRVARVGIILGALTAAWIGAVRESGAQAAAPTRPAPPDTSQRRIVIDRGDRRYHRNERGPVTRRGRLPDASPAIIASAYHDARAREIVAQARLARFHTDTGLTSYDAIVKQRLSAGLNVKAIGRDRLLFRSELAARVRWNHSNRVWVDMLGTRTAVPTSFPGAKVLTGVSELVPVPYFSGSERLMWWFNFNGGDDSDDDAFSYVHPLERGAEAVYEFQSGDSASILLPGGQAITLHEVTVRAREASPDLISGSLWFEAGGQLVRAAFRPAVPMDMMKVVGDDSFKDVPAAVRATLLTPFTFEIESFTIDYGLYGELWWLPRSQTARGELRMGFIRSIATIDQSFRYTSVSGGDSLPTVRAGMRRFSGDFGDDIGQVVQGAVDGVVPGKQFRQRERTLHCEKGDTLYHREWRNDMRMTIAMPCDTAALAHSPELPPSIFDPGEQEFNIAQARALAKELGLDKELNTLSGSSSATKSRLSYGWRQGLMRYNRVEGLSLGVLGERRLGTTYDGSALLRLGAGDLEPNVELRVTRGREQRSITLAGYHRLSSANDWGDPLGLGGSLSALLFGRDEGYYYRSSGAELTGTRTPTAASGLTWRLFAERQHNAPAETQISLPNAFRGAKFEPNVRAIAATEGGVSARLRAAHGLDPRGLRLSADVRGEAATGTFDYTRGAIDVNASRYLFGDVGLSLTGGAGTSGGTLSPQRAWHVGGTNTVRGFRPDALAGDSYWLARAELGLGGSVVRPVTFYDAGWAGPRNDWKTSTGYIRGAGVGLSFLDGLARIDLARGVDPRTAWRAHLYVEAAF